MFTVSTAQRENVKLKIGVTGPSGAGKTLSSLKLAYGITNDWTKIAVGDTENRSALYYDQEVTGPWKHIEIDPEKLPNGYHPSNWIKLIQFVEKEHPEVEVLILDSISHEWEGKGGCLDLVDQIGKGFAGWKTVTKFHNNFIDAIRLSPLHIIATMRTKQDYVVEQNDKGKSTPRKVGLKANQREGVDYEFGLVFDIDINHFARCSKDRTGLFMPRGEFKITPEVGKELVEWANSGAESEPLIEKYEALDLQKIRLAKYAKEHGVTDKATLSHMSAECMGIEMIHLEAAVREYVQDYLRKKNAQPNDHQ